MPRRIVLLRAVNVGGATLPMARVRAMATDLGATDVSTYIASGNLLVDIEGDPAAFDRALEKAIEAEFDFFREAISRTRDEVKVALDAHPFDVIEPRFSYVNFLLSEPAAGAITAAEEIETGEDQWQVIGTEMHIRYADGAGRPQMKTDTILRRLKTPGTARNLNTVRQLLERSSS